MAAAKPVPLEEAQALLEWLRAEGYILRRVRLGDLELDFGVFPGPKPVPGEEADPAKAEADQLTADEQQAQEDETVLMLSAGP